MLAVPVGAVQTGTNSEYVVVVAADGSTQRVTVTSGDLVGNLVTITPSDTGKLKAGDQVELVTTSSSGSNGGGGGFGGGGFGPGG